MRFNERHERKFLFLILANNYGDIKKSNTSHDYCILNDWKYMAMKRNVYIMANAQKCLCTVATVWTCLLSRYCVDMWIYSSYCMDRLCWFLTFSLIHYTYMQGLIQQPPSQQNGLSYITICRGIVWPLAAALQFICDFNGR